MSAPTVGGRLSTPTGRLVLPASAPRLDWLAARRDGITATDAVAITGGSNYTSPIDVWLDKTSDLPVVEDEPSEAAMWGLDFEDAIAQRWAEMHGMKVRRVGLLAKDGDDWMRASLDRLVLPGCNVEGVCGLEIKTRNAYVAEQWADGVPESVRDQVLWQIAVSGLRHIHVAALIGGQRLVEYVVERDESRIAELEAAAALFWARVVARELPEIDPATWSTDDLDRLYPAREGAVEVDPARALELLGSYGDASEAIKTLTEIKEQARTQLVHLLGSGDTAVVNGQPLYTYREQTARRVDAAKLSADWPEAWAATAKETTSRIFRVSKGSK